MDLGFQDYSAPRFRRSTFFVFATIPPTFDPMVRATSVRRSAAAAGAVVAVAGSAARLRGARFLGLFTAAFFLAAPPPLFFAGILSPTVAAQYTPKTGTG